MHNFHAYKLSYSLVLLLHDEKVNNCKQVGKYQKFLSKNKC